MVDAMSMNQSKFLFRMEKSKRNATKEEDKNVIPFIPSKQIDKQKLKKKRKKYTHNFHIEKSFKFQHRDSHFETHNYLR